MPSVETYTASEQLSYLGAREHVPEAIGCQDEELKVFLYQEILEIWLGDDLGRHNRASYSLLEGVYTSPDLLVVCPDSSVTALVER